MTNPRAPNRRAKKLTLKPPARSQPRAESDPGEIDDTVDGTIDQMRLAIDLAEAYRTRAKLPRTMSRAQILAHGLLYANVLVTMIAEDKRLAAAGGLAHAVGTLEERTNALAEFWETEIDK